MNFIQQSITDILVVEPEIYFDARGWFVEMFRQDVFEKALGYSVNFVQDNESKSSRGVLRGLHFQTGACTQSKLIRVVTGCVLDVAVDIRVGSSTFGQHVSVELTGENKRQMFIPRGFAHGFIVLSDNATLAYKVDNYYSPQSERGLAFDDEKLNIDWVLDKELIQVSEKDSKQPSFVKMPEYFNIAQTLYG